MPVAERKPYAEELRARREEAGITQKELAELLAVHPSLVAHWESGRRMPGPRDAQRLDQVLCTGGTFVRFLEKNQYPDHFDRVARAEREATRIEQFSPVLVPGLLQTSSYAHEVFRKAQISWQADELDRQVVNRLKRAEVLQRDLPQAWFILSEAALRTVVGGQSVMAEQLTHIAALVRRGRIGMQVVPFSEGAHAAIVSMLTLMRFADAPDMAYVEGLHTGNVMDANSSSSVQSCRDAYDLTRAAALSPNASLHFLESVVEEYRSHERTLQAGSAVVAQVQLQRR